MLPGMIWTLYGWIVEGFPYYLNGVGALCFCGGLWLLWRRLSMLPRSVRTMGSIARWERQRDHEDPNRFHYFPGVAFSDGHGRSHEMRIDLGFSSEKYPPGHPYAVRYDPKDPKRAYSANLMVMLIGPLVLALLGILSLAAGLKALL